MGGWVGHRANLDVVADRKIPAPARNQTLVVEPVSRYLNMFTQMVTTAFHHQAIKKNFHQFFSISSV
jgi:hypothetical protein